MHPAPLAIRALNHARREYLPTYVGLRLLFSGRAKHGLNNWIQDFSELQALANKPLPYKKYQILKAIEGGDTKYRDCYAPAPTTLLGEVYALALMAQSGSFQLSSNVYSYRWPKNVHAGNSYEYFMRGYQRRKRSISQAILESKDHVAVITDIQAFYPSCDTSLLMRRLYRRLRNSNLSEQEKKCITWFSENLFSQPECKGIPIGSALGHVFGHIALEEVDRSLTEKYQNYYFRYVDDIVVVVPSRQVDSVKEILKKEIEDAGHKINTIKTEEVSSLDWGDPTFDEDRSTSFSLLRDMITLHLSVYPDNFSVLQERLTEHDFRLPLANFRSVSQYSRFRMLLRRASSTKKYGLIGFPSVQTIISQAERVRTKIRSDYDALIRRDEGLEGIKKKWYIQKIKWSLNRLLYLLPRKDLEKLRHSIPDYDELEPSRAVIQSLITGTLDEILDLPGATINAYSQLWPLHRTDHAPELGQYRTIHIEAAAALGLWDILNIPKNLIDTEVSGRQFLDFCYSNRPNVRELNDLSYIDELRTLQIGTSESLIKEVLNSRFDDGEHTFLDALAIGSEYYD